MTFPLCSNQDFGELRFHLSLIQDAFPFLDSLLLTLDVLGVCLHVLELLCLLQRLAWAPAIHLRLCAPIYLVQGMVKNTCNQIFNAMYIHTLKCFIVMTVMMMRTVNVSGYQKKKIVSQIHNLLSQAQLKTKQYELT